MKRSLRSWLWRVSVEQEVDEELTFHLEMRTRELIARGMDPAAARQEALRRAGDLRRVTRSLVSVGRKRDREMRIGQWVEEFGGDVWFALRQVNTARGFAAVAVLTLALGIGANSAIFALADAALLRPLPYAEPDRLVALWEGDAASPRGNVNPSEFHYWSERSRVFQAMAAFLPAARAVTGPDGVTENVPSQTVTPRFFDVLGVQAIAGRTFTDSDAGAPAVVVLGERFWRQRFGGDGTIIGRALRIEGQSLTVVGIVPADFRFGPTAVPGATAPSLWTLLDAPPARNAGSLYPHYFNVIGRLQHGVSREAARADLAGVADGLRSDWAGIDTGHRVNVGPLRDRLVGTELRLTSLLLLGVVGFILLICCANIANLLLARATVRSREIAVRSALGAGRRRIVRQLLTESLVLAALGGTVGAGIGAGVLAAGPGLLPPGLLPIGLPVQFDSRVVIFCGVTVLIVAVSFGLLPAWQSTGAHPGTGLAASGRSASGSARAVNPIVIAELAIAVLLLCGAGVLARTLWVLNDVESGDNAANVFTMTLSPGMLSDPAAMLRFYDAVEREVRAVPGVRNMAWGAALPFDGSWYGQSFEIDGDPNAPAPKRESASYQIVSPSYFDVLGVPVLQGRNFTDRDVAGTTEVCIVDEAFVRRYLVGKAPLGTRVTVNAMGPSRPVVREIVGVVTQLKERPQDLEDQPHIYVPIAQNTWWSASLLVEASNEPTTALTRAVRDAVARVNSDRPLTPVRTLDDIKDQATAAPRFRAVLVGSFAALALALAMVGVFGVLAYSVQRRTREFGVRVALGARAADVVLLVVGETARLAVTGAAIGLIGAALLGRLVSSFLFGVPPRDPIAFAAAVGILLLTSAAATAAPAIRAMTVDAAVTLRGDE
jgi:putative ABC transport system permease protein